MCCGLGASRASRDDGLLGGVSHKDGARGFVLDVCVCVCVRVSDQRSALSSGFVRVRVGVVAGSSFKTPSNHSHTYVSKQNISVLTHSPPPTPSDHNNSVFTTPSTRIDEDDALAVPNTCT